MPTIDYTNLREQAVVCTDAMLDALAEQHDNVRSAHNLNRTGRLDQWVVWISDDGSKVPPRFRFDPDTCRAFAAPGYLVSAE